MGFLIKIISYSALVLFFYGCAPSLIKVNVYSDSDPYLQYGKISQRTFNNDLSINLDLAERWESDINGGFSLSSITAYDSVIFINDLSGRIYSFSLSNGKNLGQLKFKGSIFTTPVIQKSSIYFTVVSERENSSTFVVYDFKNGKEKATKGIKGRITNQLLLSDEYVYALSDNGILYKFSLTGELIWQFETNSFCHSNLASNNELIVFGNDDGELICVNIQNFSKPLLVYRKKVGSSFFAGCVINDGQVYLSDNSGILYSIELKTGEVIWSFNCGSKITMEAIVSKDEVFIGSLKGKLFKLNKNNGKKIWEIDSKGLLNITPLLTKQYLILPDANRKLKFIDRNSGEIIKTISFDGRLKLNPVIKNNFLIVGYENGKLKAYEVKYD